MKVSYDKNYSIFDNIYMNRSARLAGEIVKKLNKLSLPHDKNFIRDVNKLREDLYAANTLYDFNRIRQKTNGFLAEPYVKQDNLELEYKVHIDYSNVKHFICMNNEDYCYSIKEFDKNLMNITSIRINRIHNHKKYRNKIKK